MNSEGEIKKRTSVRLSSMSKLNASFLRIKISFSLPKNSLFAKFYEENMLLRKTGHVRSRRLFLMKKGCSLVEDFLSIFFTLAVFADFVRTSL